MSTYPSDLIAWPWIDDAPAVSDNRMLRGAFLDIQVVSNDHALYLYQWDKSATDITLHFVTLEGRTIASPTIPLEFEPLDILRLTGAAAMTITLGQQWEAWHQAQPVGTTTINYDLLLSYGAVVPLPDVLDELTQGGLNYGKGTTLYNGYNTTLSKSSADITINAYAGSGAGLSPADCAEDCAPNYITTLNSTHDPDESGSAFITTEACTSINSKEATAATLFYENDCEPCCSCSDMAGILERMRKDLNGVALNAHNAIQSATAVYQDNFDYYTDEVVPKLKVVEHEVNMGLGIHPAVTIRFSNRGDDTNVSVSITGVDLQYKGFSSTIDGPSSADGATSFTQNFTLESLASATMLVQIAPQDPAVTSATVSVTANGTTVQTPINWSAASAT